MKIRVMPEHIRHQAGMLPARTAEALQRVARSTSWPRITEMRFTALAMLPTAISQRRRSDFLRADGAAGGACHALRQLGEALAQRHSRSSDSLPLGPNTRGKNARLNAPEQDVGVGDGKRPAAPITCRSRVGARRFGAHPQPRAVEPNDRPAAGGDAVNAHHRRANPHPAHLGIKGAFVLAGKMAHIGGGAAHVEADQLARARAPARCAPCRRSRRPDLKESHPCRGNAAHWVKPPELCMKKSGTPGMRSASLSHIDAEWAKGTRRPPSYRRAAPASSSGLTRCDTEICVKPTRGQCSRLRARACT